MINNSLRSAWLSTPSLRTWSRSETCNQWLRYLQYICLLVRYSFIVVVDNNDGTALVLEPQHLLRLVVKGSIQPMTIVFFRYRASLKATSTVTLSSYMSVSPTCSMVRIFRSFGLVLLKVTYIHKVKLIVHGDKTDLMAQ